MLRIIRCLSPRRQLAERKKQLEEQRQRESKEQQKELKELEDKEKEMQERQKEYQERMKVLETKTETRERDDSVALQDLSKKEQEYLKVLSPEEVKVLEKKEKKGFFSIFKKKEKESGSPSVTGVSREHSDSMSSGNFHCYLYSPMQSAEKAMHLFQIDVRASPLNLKMIGKKLLLRMERRIIGTQRPEKQNGVNLKKQLLPNQIKLLIF